MISDALVLFLKVITTNNFLLFLFLRRGLVHLAVCKTLGTQPGIEPRPSAVKAPCPNYWITMEFPEISNKLFCVLPEIFYA